MHLISVKRKQLLDVCPDVRVKPMSDNKKRISNMDEKVFRFMLSQLEEIERTIRHNEEFHGSQEKFFLGFLGALISIVTGLLIFRVPIETRFVVLASLMILVLAFMVSLVFLVLQIERRIVTYEWIRRAICLRSFFIAEESPLASYFRRAKLPFRLEEAPKYWPLDGFGRHPLFKVSLAFYIVINSFLAGGIAFALTYYFVEIVGCSMITGVLTAVFLSMIEWMKCKNFLQRKDTERT